MLFTLFSCRISNLLVPCLVCFLLNFSKGGFIMRVYGVNIIDPPLFGPYSIHAVPTGKYEREKHSNARLKIFLDDDCVGYLRLQPKIFWQVEPPSYGNEILQWAEVKIGEIMVAIKQVEKGQKPTKITTKITSALHTKAIDVWANKKTKDLFVKFSDGKIKKLNMEDALEGLLNTWAGEILNPDIFEKVTVKNGMPTWPNGFDFDTDVIYDYGEDAPNAVKIAGKKI